MSRAETTDEPQPGDLRLKDGIWQVYVGVRKQWLPVPHTPPELLATLKRFTGVSGSGQQQFFSGDSQAITEAQLREEIKATAQGGGGAVGALIDQEINAGGNKPKRREFATELDAVAYAASTEQEDLVPAWDKEAQAWILAKPTGELTGKRVPVEGGGSLVQVGTPENPHWQFVPLEKERPAGLPPGTSVDLPGGGRVVGVGPGGHYVAPPGLPTLDQLIRQALSDGDLDKAITLANFKKRPGSLDLFQAALEYARSPADVFTISNIARGNQIVAPPPAGTFQRIGPQPEFLTQAFQNLLRQGIPQQALAIDGGGNGVYQLPAPPVPLAPALPAAPPSEMPVNAPFPNPGRPSMFVTRPPFPQAQQPPNLDFPPEATGFNPLSPEAGGATAGGWELRPDGTSVFHPGTPDEEEPIFEFALGGIVPFRGRALVGELGPEIVDLPQGATLRPMADSPYPGYAGTRPSEPGSPFGFNPAHGWEYIDGVGWVYKGTQGPGLPDYGTTINAGQATRNPNLGERFQIVNGGVVFGQGGITPEEFRGFIGPPDLALQRRRDVLISTAPLLPQFINPQDAIRRGLLGGVPSSPQEGSGGWIYDTRAQTLIPIETAKLESARAIGLESLRSNAGRVVTSPPFPPPPPVAAPRVPRGVQQIVAGRSIEPPRSLFAPAGLTVPSAQALRNLLPEELEAMAEIGRLAGIPQGAYQRELRSAIPRIGPLPARFSFAPRNVLMRP